MGFKLHSPSWHSGGRKYKMSNTYAGWSLGVDGKGKIRGRWRSGWREHGKSDDSVVASAVPRLKSVRALVRPQTSARSLAVSGNYKNPLRSTVYG